MNSFVPLQCEYLPVSLTFCDSKQNIFGIFECFESKTSYVKTLGSGKLGWTTNNPLTN